MRYFYEQIPDLHVIATDSLLEFAFQPPLLKLLTMNYTGIS